MFLFVTALLEEVQSFVEGNAIEPSRHFGLATEAVNSFPSLDEDVLHEVIGVIVAVDHTTYLPVNLLRIEAHDRGEGTPPTLGVS